MKAWKIVLITIAGSAAFFLLLFCLTTRLMPEGEFSLPGSQQESSIAVVHISGEISSDNSESYNQDWLLGTLDDIQADPNNAAMLLVIDTPGGGVYECDEIYQKILAYRKAGRPVYVSMAKYATSGGYYISAPCNKIYANRNTITGSIGILSGTFLDVTGFLNEHGIRATEIKSGKNKAMGSMLEPYTQEQLAIMQAVSNESYEQFLDVVATGRKMDKAALRRLADGRIYTARQALANGLIDGIKTQDEVEAQMVADLKLPDASFYDYEYVPQFHWTDLLSMKSSTAEELSAIVSTLTHSSMLPAYLAPIR